MWREMNRRSAISRVSRPSTSSATSSRSRVLSPCARESSASTSSGAAERKVTAIALAPPSTRLASTTAQPPSPPRTRMRAGCSSRLALLGGEQPADDAPDEVGIPSGKGVPAGFSASNQARAAAVGPAGAQPVVEQQHAGLRRR